MYLNQFLLVVCTGGQRMSDLLGLARAKKEREVDRKWNNPIGTVRPADHAPHQAPMA